MFTWIWRNLSLCRETWPEEYVEYKFYFLVLASLSTTANTAFGNCYNHRGQMKKIYDE